MFLIFADLVCSSVDDLRNVEGVTKALRTSLASKQYGYEDFLAKLISKACGKHLARTQDFLRYFCYQFSANFETK